jgi:hypothetical protein
LRVLKRLRKKSALGSKAILQGLLKRVWKGEEKQQVPPLRYAPVGMTILWYRKSFSEKSLALQ